MAYSASAPPYLVVQPITGGTNKVSVWIYVSTDPATTVDDTGYITNADALGMKVGDVVIVLDSDTSTTMTFHRVTSVTAGGAGNLSTTGLTIT